MSAGFSYLCWQQYKLSAKFGDNFQNNLVLIRGLPCYVNDEISSYTFNLMQNSATQDGLGFLP